MLLILFQIQSSMQEEHSAKIHLQVGFVISYSKFEILSVMLVNFLCYKIYQISMNISCRMITRSVCMQAELEERKQEFAERQEALLSESSELRQENTELKKKLIQLIK